MKTPAKEPIKKLLNGKLFRAKDPTNGEPAEIVWDAVLPGYGMRPGARKRALLVQTRIADGGGQYKEVFGRARSEGFVSLGNRAVIVPIRRHSYGLKQAPRLNNNFEVVIIKESLAHNCQQ